MSDRRKELDPEADEQPVGERDPRYGNLIGTQRDRSHPHEDGYLEPAEVEFDDSPTTVDEEGGGGEDTSED
ncbi:MAG TPA: hypothetical protein VFD39_01090 [Trueperaceae bacterium]|nr:hypothetical protein [Trueperaceae bacterium]